MNNFFKAALSIGPEFTAAAQANPQGAMFLLVLTLVLILTAKK